MTRILLLLLCLLSLPSCVSTGGGVPEPVAFPDARPKTRIYLDGVPHWQSLSDVRAAVGGKATLKGSVLDLGGAELNGSRIKHPKNPQDEGAIPLKISLAGLTIRNGQVRDIPGGLKVYAADCRFEDLLFRDIGEDALSNVQDKAPGMTVIRCRFENGKPPDHDKGLQANDGRDFAVRDSWFTGGETALRIQESSAKKHGNAEVLRNRFTNVPTAVNVAGKARVKAAGNQFEGVAKRWVIGGSARVDEQ